MVVDARSRAMESILAFEVNMVGGWAKTLRSVSGFPILCTHRFGSVVQVEINAFVVSEGSGAAWLEDL